MSKWFRKKEAGIGVATYLASASLRMNGKRDKRGRKRHLLGEESGACHALPSSTIGRVFFPVHCRHLELFPAKANVTLRVMFMYIEKGKKGPTTQIRLSRIPYV